MRGYHVTHGSADGVTDEQVTWEFCHTLLYSPFFLPASSGSRDVSSLLPTRLPWSEAYKQCSEASEDICSLGCPEAFGHSDEKLTNYLISKTEVM